MNKKLRSRSAYWKKKRQENPPRPLSSGVKLPHCGAALSKKPSHPPADTLPGLFLPALKSLSYLHCPRKSQDSDHLSPAHPPGIEAQFHSRFETPREQLQSGAQRCFQGGSKDTESPDRKEQKYIKAASCLLKKESKSLLQALPAAPLQLLPQRQRQYPPRYPTGAFFCAHGEADPPPAPPVVQERPTKGPAPRRSCCQERPAAPAAIFLYCPSSLMFVFNHL